MGSRELTKRLICDNIKRNRQLAGLSLFEKEELMSLGGQWKSALGAKALGEKEQEAVKKAQRRREIIAKLPDLVQEAISKKLEKVMVYGYMTQEDALGDVDEFFKRTRGRLLTRVDVGGIARSVVEWCQQNGLEVYIEPVRIQLNDDEYNLVAKPARE